MGPVETARIQSLESDFRKKKWDGSDQTVGSRVPLCRRQETILGFHARRLSKVSADDRTLGAVPRNDSPKLPLSDRCQRQLRGQAPSAQPEIPAMRDARQADTHICWKHAESDVCHFETVGLQTPWVRWLTGMRGAPTSRNTASVQFFFKGTARRLRG